MPVAPLSVTARKGLPWSSIRIVPALPSAVWSMNAARRHGSSTARVYPAKLAPSAAQPRSTRCYRGGVGVRIELDDLATWRATGLGRARDAGRRCLERFWSGRSYCLAHDRDRATYSRRPFTRA